MDDDGGRLAAADGLKFDAEPALPPSSPAWGNACVVTVLAKQKSAFVAARLVEPLSSRSNS
jgi:hypothetical protein